MSRRDQWPWVVSAVSAILVVAGGSWLLRRPAGLPKPDGPGRTLAIQLARPGGEDRALQDEAILRDPRPLFLPTAQNAALPDPRREAGGALFELDRVADEPGDADSLVVRGLPPVASLNGRPASSATGADALGVGQVEVGVVGFGREARSVEPIVPRGGFLQVVSASSGVTLLAEPLGPGLAPAGGKVWEPLELFAVVDAAGLAAPLALVSSSNVDEIDGHFRRILDQVFRIGERLPPGFFRVVVGP
jgi:hypothetical protein